MKQLKCLICLLLALSMIISDVPQMAEHVHAEETVETDKELEFLYQEIVVQPGQLITDTNEIVENEIYGYVVDYELKKGHVLSISDSNYVFSVRQYKDGNYSTLLKQATTASFTATEDMTVGMLIRKPDKSALTEEELASIVIKDTLYGMEEVDGYVHRFTVDAETINGDIASTRCNIFLPATYSESGDPTKLMIMTHGFSGYLNNSVWYSNTENNRNLVDAYINEGYAVIVVDNTAASTSQTADIGCPQLVDSYLKAYTYVQENFNVEEKFSIHSRSFGTFAAMRIMLEVPELVKCAIMTGPRVSTELAYNSCGQKAFVADRFGFDDVTGTTYEADKFIGRDPYTDVEGEEYELPPTYWVMATGDSTTEPLEVIEKIKAHGNTAKTVTYSDTTHTGVCTLETDEMKAGLLSF